MLTKKLEVQFKTQIKEVNNQLEGSKKTISEQKHLLNVNDTINKTISQEIEGLKETIKR